MSKFYQIKIKLERNQHRSFGVLSMLMINESHFCSKHRHAHKAFEATDATIVM